MIYNKTFIFLSVYKCMGINYICQRPFLQYRCFFCPTFRLPFALISAINALSLEHELM